MYRVKCPEALAEFPFFHAECINLTIWQQQLQLLITASCRILLSLSYFTINIFYYFTIFYYILQFYYVAYTLLSNMIKYVYMDTYFRTLFKVTVMQIM